MRKYPLILKNWIIRHLSYRARVALWFLVDCGTFLAFPFIWLSVYGNRPSLYGFTRADIVTYYLIIAFIGTIATSHISRAVRTGIIKGELNASLVKPVNFLLYESLRDLGYHLIFVPVSTITLLALLYFVPQYISPPASFADLFLFIAAIILAYLISMCLELLIGLSSFWLGETAGLAQVRQITEIVLSGQIAPLTFFPLAVGKIAGWLPFQYMFYFPTQVYLHKLPYSVILAHFARAGGWVVTLMALIYILWRKGLKSYEGSGI